MPYLKNRGLFTQKSQFPQAAMAVSACDSGNFLLSPLLLAENCMQQTKKVSASHLPRQYLYLVRYYTTFCQIFACIGPDKYELPYGAAFFIRVEMFPARFFSEFVIEREFVCSVFHTGLPFSANNSFSLRASYFRIFCSAESRDCRVPSSSDHVLFM